MHKRVAWSRPFKWPVLAAVTVGCVVFVYAIVVVTATHSGKYGAHLLKIVGG